MIENSNRRESDEEDSLSEFCRQFVCRNFTAREILTGSCFELPIHYFLVNMTDSDSLVCRQDLCAVPPDESAPASFSGTVLTIFSSESHPGFTKLISIRPGEKPVMYTRDQFPRQSKGKHPAWESALFGPTELHRVLEEAGLGKMGLGLQIEQFKTVTKDWVDAIYCQFWPSEADEWKTRERHNGWPTLDVIENVVSGGCCFVVKPHQSNPDNDAEWRFSFSRAELILIHSWSDLQKFIYHILRVIKGEIVTKCGGKEKSILNTYQFKTLMFWACEEKPCDFWNETAVEECLKGLLGNMIENLIDKKCLNYFIPSNNMLDHLPSDHDVTNEVQHLQAAMDGVDRFFSPHRGPGYLIERVTMDIPNKFFLTLLVSFGQSHFVNPSGPGLQRYRLKNGIEQCSLFQRDMKWLYKALSAHRRFNTVRDHTGSQISPSVVEPNIGLTVVNRAGRSCEELPSDLRVLREETENYFKLARQPRCIGSTTVSFSLTGNVHDLIEEILRKGVEHLNEDSNCSMKHSKGCDNDKKSSAGNKTIGVFSNLIPNSPVKNAIYQVSPNGICTSIPPMFVELLSREFFTALNNDFECPSHFICLAYEANFYYTALKDYRKSLELYRTGSRLFIEAKQKFANRMTIAYRLLQVAVTNKWAPIFDEPLQVLHGFMTLCATLKSIEDDRTRKRRAPVPVLIHISAELFLKYIGIQCTRLLPDADKKIDTEEMKYIQDHPASNWSRFFLLTALKIFRPL